MDWLITIPKPIKWQKYQHHLVPIVDIGEQIRILYVIKGREVFYETIKVVKAVKLTNKLPENITRPKQLTKHVRSGIAIQDD